MCREGNNNSEISRIKEYISTRFKNNVINFQTSPRSLKSIDRIEIYSQNQLLWMVIFEREVNIDDTFYIHIYTFLNGGAL